jgi:hypothetical protein
MSIISRFKDLPGLAAGMRDEKYTDFSYKFRMKDVFWRPRGRRDSNIKMNTAMCCVSA